MMFYDIILIVFLLSAVFTWASTNLLIGRLRHRGIVGVDGHKPDKPKIPEMGGLSVLLGYTLAIVCGIVVIHYLNPGLSKFQIIAPLLVFLIAGLVGFIDDLKKLHHHVKPLLLLAAALPLVLLRAGAADIRVPFFTFSFSNVFGLDMSLLYWLVVVPVAITGAANVSNMLAGFNGLSSGLGVISSAALAVIGVIYGRPEVVLIFSGMAGAQLAFLWFNRYPARIFPGDTGTLSFGAFFAAGIIVGNVEFLGFLVFLPQILNASMSLLSVGGFFEEKQFRKEKLSALKISPEGLLSFTRLEKPITLCKLLLYGRPQMEYELVMKVWLLAILCSSVAILLAWVI
jgi:UDP-N-acetylglucosamine--dolichyl-phosphate N-acetylglucosaminephosphotransferase